MSMDLIDIAMAAAMKKGGGGGETTDYTDLSNKPSINGNQLVGDKSTKQLGIKEPWVGTAAQYAQEAATIPAGTPIIITDDQDMDTVPTSGSSNPVTSDGIYRELAKLKVINENPENHNGIYRGKNLTNVYTVEQIYERVHDGSFEDLYLGDYFTVHLTTDLYTRFTGAEFVAGTTYYEMGGGTDVTQRTWMETQDSSPQSGKVYATKQVVEEDVDLMIASFDYYMNCGVSVKMTDHHVILIPRVGFANMAPIQTSGIVGYNESDVHNITLPCYAASIKAALNSHIRTMSVRLPSTITESTPSMAGAGYMGATAAAVTGNVELMLPTENQIFGTKIMGSSYFDIGLEYQKLEIFNFINYTPTSTNTPRALRTFTHIATGNKLYYEVLLWTGQVSSGGAANLRELCPTMVMG